MLKSLYYKIAARVFANVIEGRGLLGTLLAVVNLVYLGNIRLVLALGLFFMFAVLYVLGAEVVNYYFQAERSSIKGEIENLRSQLKTAYNILIDSYALHSDLVFVFSKLLMTHKSYGRFYTAVKIDNTGNYMFIGLKEAVTMLFACLEIGKPKITAVTGPRNFNRQGVDVFRRKGFKK